MGANLLGSNLDGNLLAWKLVMDEPTNDLDIETLELLESLLVDYQGTVLPVSHDRAFPNDVVTSTLVIENDGLVKEYEGGYDDYLRQRPAEPASQSRRGHRRYRPGFLQCATAAAAAAIAASAGRRL